ncbi:MAG: hypothetical protein M1822_007905 [Bathelium mastoideum]|nr:MAG: hypothetical protein M1822_007905 [Bathelium mastoideum]
MASTPIVTFKAGRCEYDSSAKKVKPLPGPGYIYLYSEDDLMHFCWRPRSAPSTEPELDLLMVPSDGSFIPYLGADGDTNTEWIKSPTTGRIYVLKFSSSSQRHFFWLQSKSQEPSGNPSAFSQRDQKLGQIVDMLLSGQEVNVQEELQDLHQQGGGRDQDGDDTMEDVQGPNGDSQGPGSGGAGAGATGGDVRDEGEESREGGADGARAFSAEASQNDASEVVRNFLNSIPGSNLSALGGQQATQDQPVVTLPDLFPSNITVPMLDSADPAFIDKLCSLLPPSILVLAQEADDPSTVEPTEAVAQAALEALSVGQKKDILRRVLRSPQMTQSMASLTVALRDGGLPTVSEALKLKVENGGYIRGGSMPLGGAQAINAFLEGLKKVAEEEQKGRSGGANS